MNSNADAGVRVIAEVGVVDVSGLAFFAGVGQCCCSVVMPVGDETCAALTKEQLSSTRCWSSTLSQSMKTNVLSSTLQPVRRPRACDR